MKLFGNNFPLREVANAVQRTCIISLPLGLPLGVCITCLRVTCGRDTSAALRTPRTSPNIDPVTCPHSATVSVSRGINTDPLFLSGPQTVHTSPAGIQHWVFILHGVEHRMHVVLICPQSPPVWNPSSVLSPMSLGVLRRADLMFHWMTSSVGPPPACFLVTGLGRCSPDRDVMEMRDGACALLGASWQESQ